MEILWRIYLALALATVIVLLVLAQPARAGTPLQGLPAMLEHAATAYVPCGDEREAVACAERWPWHCVVRVGARYRAMTRLCRDLVLAHQALHCLAPWTAYPPPPVLAECAGGIDLTNWLTKR